MVDPHKLFSGVFTDLREIINYNPDGEDHILTIFNYVDAMRCQLWEIAFFIELGGDNAAHNNNPRKNNISSFKLTTGPFTCTFQTTWILKIMNPCSPLVFVKDHYIR
jgi:hypothetical protein